MLVWREAAVEQGQLFESNVINLAEFRERRQLASVDRPFPVPRSTFPVLTLNTQSVAHRALMLANLQEQARAIGK
jgi:hypothetical protein